MKKLSMLLASVMMTACLVGCSGDAQPTPTAPATPAPTGTTEKPKDEKPKDDKAATPPAETKKP